MPERLPPPDTCANCGAHLLRSARACPECGADETTGWREDSIYDGLDLPEEAWRDDQENPSRDASRKRTAPHVNGVAWYWWCAGAMLVAALVLGVLGLR